MTSVGREPQYEAHADDFLAHAADGFFNAHVDRPACLGLLGDVTGAHVLDAACGPGLYARELVARGATVTGFDHSPRMVAIARSRVPAATLHVHDLADPLDFLADDSVDAVLFALAYEYVDDRPALLREFRRVLRPGGALVLSRLHPTGEWLRHGGSYFDTRVVEEDYGDGFLVRQHTVPLEQTCEELQAAGFLVERLLEPRPQPAAEALDPVHYAELTTRPTGFLTIRAIRAVPRA